MFSQESSATVLPFTKNSRPRVSLLWRSSARVSALHAIELRWRFENPPLVGLPESGFSGQLERAQLFSKFGFKPCKKCGGERYPSEKNGSGWAPAGKLADYSYKQALRVYRKTYAKKHNIQVVKHQRSVELMGILFDDLPEKERNKPGRTVWLTQERFAELIPSLPLEVCRQCPTCNGDGVLERMSKSRSPLTARPTGSSKGGTGKKPSVSLDENSLVRYGWISRVLELVTQRDGWARAAIEVYFSEGGGSTVALWRHTDNGQKFLENTPNKLGIPPDAIFEEAREQQKKSPTIARARALADIVSETDQRWDDACRTWNDCAKEVPAPHLERKGQ